MDEKEYFKRMEDLSNRDSIRLVQKNGLLMDETNSNGLYLTKEQSLQLIALARKSYEFALENDVESLNTSLDRSYNPHFYEVIDLTPKQKPDPATQIYVMIDRNTGFYKIGRSINVLAREKTLQSEKPSIELCFSFSSNISKEKELHTTFSDKRVRGEWFRLDDNDILQIKKQIL